MDDMELTIENNGAVRRIWLNRPDAANAQTRQMLIELDQAILDAGQDDSVNVVVLAGKGKNFSAGHDMKEAEAKRSDFTVEERYRYEELHYLEYCLRIWDCPKPTISQVQGACILGGYMVASMSDLVVAADDAWFWESATHTFGIASTEVLFQPWVMGLRHAKEFLFTGERITAQEGYRIGMVNRVYPRAELDDRTMELAQRVAKASPFATRVLKKSLNRTYDMQGFRAAVQAHFDTHQLTHAASGFAKVRDAGLSNVIASNKKAIAESHSE